MVLVWETLCKNGFNRLLLTRINSHQIQRFLAKPYSFGWLYSYPSVCEDRFYIQLKHQAALSEFCCCGAALQGRLWTTGQMTFLFSWGSSGCCWMLVFKTGLKTFFPTFFYRKMSKILSASKMQRDCRKQPPKLYAPVIYETLEPRKCKYHILGAFCTAYTAFKIKNWNSGVR